MMQLAEGLLLFKLYQLQRQNNGLLKADEQKYDEIYFFFKKWQLSISLNYILQKWLKLTGTFYWVVDNLANNLFERARWQFFDPAPYYRSIK